MGHAHFAEDRFNGGHILHSPELQKKIISYLIDVHSKCQKDKNYGISLVYKLQYDLKLSQDTVRYMVENGIKLGILIRDKRIVRFNDNQPVPSSDMLYRLLEGYEEMRKNNKKKCITLDLSNISKKEVKTVLDNSSEKKLRKILHSIIDLI